MKYTVMSTHRQSGVESDVVAIQAVTPRAAVLIFTRSFGSLGMLNYAKQTAYDYDAGWWCYEVMGTSGMVLDVTVRREARA